MKKQLFPLALWMFFGFVLISAVDSLLSFIINTYFYFGIWMVFSADFLKYSIPILSVLVYTLTIVLVLKYVNQIAINFELNKTEFPKIVYITAAIIAIFLNPARNKLTGLISEKLAATEHYETLEFYRFFGITQSSIAICRWTAIIILSIYFYRIYKKKEIKTEE